MLAIKLQRVGKKHQPSYRIIVAEKRSKMVAPPIEDLGIYDPFTKKVNVSSERVTYWIEKGAQPTVSMHNLFVKEKVLAGKAKPVKMAKLKPKEVAPAVAVTAPAAAPATPASEPATEALAIASTSEVPTA